MTGKEWFSAVIATVAMFLFFWYLLDAIKNIDTSSLPLAALILLVLLCVAIFTCPCIRKHHKELKK